MIYTFEMRCSPLLVFLVAGCSSTGGQATVDSGGGGTSGAGPVEGPDRFDDSAGDTADPQGEPGPPVRLFINELMPANDGAVDLDGSTPDWVELYNPGSEVVALGGFSITDDLDEPRKVVLDPSLEVPAAGFLVLWASGEEGAAEHLPFKLSSEGEAVGIFFPDGTPADRIEFGAMSDNLALARTEDGGDEWAVTITPTLGEANEID